MFDKPYIWLGGAIAALAVDRYETVVLCLILVAGTFLRRGGNSGMKDSGQDKFMDTAGLWPVIFMIPTPFFPFAIIYLIWYWWKHERE
jgi:hypothetical protein